MFYTKTLNRRHDSLQCFVFFNFSCLVTSRKRTAMIKGIHLREIWPSLRIIRLPSKHTMLIWWRALSKSSKQRLLTDHTITLNIHVYKNTTISCLWQPWSISRKLLISLVPMQIDTAALLTRLQGSLLLLFILSFNHQCCKIFTSQGWIPIKREDDIF